MLERTRRNGGASAGKFRLGREAGHRVGLGLGELLLLPIPSVLVVTAMLVASAFDGSVSGGVFRQRPHPYEIVDHPPLTRFDPFAGFFWLGRRKSFLPTGRSTRVLDRFSTKPPKDILVDYRSIPLVLLEAATTVVF